MGGHLFPLLEDGYIYKYGKVEKTDEKSEKR